MKDILLLSCSVACLFVFCFSLWQTVSWNNGDGRIGLLACLFYDSFTKGGFCFLVLFHLFLYIHFFLSFRDPGGRCFMDSNGRHSSGMGTDVGRWKTAKGKVSSCSRRHVKLLFVWITSLQTLKRQIN